MKKIITILSTVCVLGVIVGCNIQTEENTTDNRNTILNAQESQLSEEINNSGEEQVSEIDIALIEESLSTSGDNEVPLVEDITVEVIPVSNVNLSNTTFAWGFRRMKDNAQPEFTASYTKVLDDYEGIYVGNKDDKNIYLTFDEGYENGYTSAILDTLKEKEVTAVFFVTMPYVKKNPELVQRMIDEGHIVGNHISRTSMYHIKIS